MDIKNNKESAKARIRALARQHGITAQKTGVDYMSQKYAELSGDAVDIGDIGIMCLNLKRAGIITDSESTELYFRTLKGE